MEKDELYYLFKTTREQLDCDIPNTGHTARFLKKLSKGTEEQPSKPERRRNYLAPLLAVAALLVLFFALNIFKGNTQTPELADVSAEMLETQRYFTRTINSQLSQIEGNRSPETKKLIEDAMKQLSILEKDYKQLQNDLQVSGDDQRVISAMISNFQTRIELLQNVLAHINQLTDTKNDSYEITTTI